MRNTSFKNQKPTWVQTLERAHTPGKNQDRLHEKMEFEMF